MLFQLIAVAVVLLIAATAPNFDWPALRKLRRAWNRLARRKVLSITLVGATAFAIAAAMSLAVHMPVPAVHDEFAYLLGADTFAHGRLTNPTHPLWEHFESFHIIHQPTYQMKYPPGQSLLLAVGQVLGHPVIGVWLGMALAAAATCWMLYGWVPPRWALLGGVLMLLNWQMFRWWGQIYWGGALAMCGGALLFGALPRLRRRPRAGTSIVMAIGIAILANTRPYEGLITALVAAVALIAWLIGKHRPRLKTLALHVILPTTAALLTAAAWMGYYNYRVTGDALKMPYQVWSDTYGYGSLTSVLVFTEDTPPLRRRIPLPGMEERDARRRENSRARNANHPVKFLLNWNFFVGPLLTIPLCMLPCVLRQRGMGFVLLAALAVLAAVVFQNTQAGMHYTAPVGALFYLLVIQGLRHLQQCRLGDNRFGRTVVQLIPVALAACFLLSFCSWTQNPGGSPWIVHRVDLEKRLLREEGKHLVVVRYAPSHIADEEWVYNEADIDGARIVWARELSPEQNVPLLEYFGDRQVWLVEPDVQPPRLTRHER